MHLSLIIPARNEEKRLPRTLDAYIPHLTDAFGDQFELLIVVNHCTDNTEAIAKEVAQEHDQVKCIVEPEQVGKGGALVLGMQQAKGDLVGFVDADCSTSPGAFQQLVEQIGDASCIIASRWIQGAVVSPRQPWARRIASYLLNKLIVRMIFRLNVSDSQCGAKLFRKEVLLKLSPETLERGWAFDIDLLLRIKQLPGTMIEHPTQWGHTPGQSIAYAKQCVEMVQSILRVALCRNTGK